MSFNQTGSLNQDPESIENDAFFPDINPSSMRDTMRIDGTVTPERLTHELIEAMANVNTQLSGWKQQQVESGYATLASVPAPEISGKSTLEYRYIRAVFCIAAASINERFRAFDSTNAGNKKAEDNEPTIDDLRRDAFWAIADIQAKPRTVVEMI